METRPRRRPVRRPHLFAILLRWRVEVLSLAFLAMAVHLDWLATASALASLAALAAVVPAVRREVVGVVLATICTHRVRVGLVEAGISDRRFRVPWLLWAMPEGPKIRVMVMLHAGITINDVRSASETIRSACGAAAVEVVDVPMRPDLAYVMVGRPRWGLPVA